MTIENVYSYLEYLALTVDQLADAVVQNEEETAVLEARVKEMGDALVQAQKELDKAEARAAMAETRAYNADMKVQEMAVVAKSAKQQQRPAVEGQQTDLFGAPVAAPQSSQAPVTVSKAGRVANDESALILAKKLDSTIDKVQKLIREARA